MNVYLYIFILMKKSIQLILTYVLIFLKRTAEPNAMFCFKDFWMWHYVNVNGQTIKQLVQNTI